MRYAQLRAFHHVALHGGFSRAADAMNQSQPSLSDQVRKLEQAHDVLLFHRDGRRISLTTAGEELFRLTSEFFEHETRIGDFLNESRAEATGTLRIVADSAHHVTGLVGQFRAAYRNVYVALHTGNTEEVLTKLRNYEADVGVVGNMISAPDLDIHDLGKTPIVAMVAEGFLPARTKSVTLDDLRKHPLVFREKGSRTRAALEEAVGKTGKELVPVLEVEGREAMREVVATGAGIGFVSQAEFGHDVRLRALPIRDVRLEMSEALVTLKARRDVPVIRAFLKTLDA
jgi:aminoethylphosphonate catabolism LysR family transcriptional regulator